MDKRKRETPRTLLLGELAKSLGDCVDGSTADQLGSGCTEGMEALKMTESCYVGGLASGDCSSGGVPGL